jgi:glycosyltransferase involved in cell wall biosynthesis
LWGRIRLVRLLRKLEPDVDVFQIEAPSLIVSGGIYRLLGGRVPVVARLHTYSWFCSNIGRMDWQCHRRCSLFARIIHRPENPIRKLFLAPFRVAEDLLSRLAARRIDWFISLSPAVSEIHALRGIDLARMIVVPPTLREGLSPQATTLADRSPGAPLRLLYVGRLTPEKGVDVLLQAVACSSCPLEVDVVGQGPSEAYLKGLAAALGIEKAVRFHGWVSQPKIRDFYAAAHAFVHPARWPEPAGRTVMEALALGLPVITSDVGGPPTIAGDAALTFAAGNVRDLSEKIETLAADPSLSRRMSAAGIEKAGNFRRDVVRGRLLRFYAGLLGGPEGTPEPAAVRSGPA